VCGLRVPVCEARFYLLCIVMFRYIKVQHFLQPAEVNEGIEMGMTQLDLLLCMSAPFHQKNHQPAEWEVQADYQ